MKRQLILVLFILLITYAPGWSKTLVIDGLLSGEIDVTHKATFVTEKELNELTYRIPLPVAYGVRSIRQRVVEQSITFTPKPAIVKDETDFYGNRFKVVTWKHLTGDAYADLNFTAFIDAELGRKEALAPFPVKTVPEEIKLYLQPTGLVQSSDRSIADCAAKLTVSSVKQFTAVDAILNFVNDHIHYEASPRSYDALESLRTGRGNCQNYAHLAVALLRASGIPARVAVGLTLKNKWKIPTGNGQYIVQSMGEGFHAWVEVWFPDLGWLPYDPQQSKQFTSTRHIKYAHSLECKNITPSWISTPALPQYHGTITANYRKDLVDIRLKNTGTDPRGYLASFEFVPAPAAPATAPIALAPKPAPSVPKPLEPPPKHKPQPVSEPKPVQTPPLKPKPEPPKSEEKSEPKVKPKPGTLPDVSGKGSFVEIGHSRLPNLTKIYTVSDGRGELTMESETAEYITSRYVFAQAFRIEKPLILEKVSLALHKFGGDGTVYVDVVHDDGGKPGLAGFRSIPVSLDKMKRQAGYDWVDFTFPSGNDRLSSGKYWIVLRHSGEVVMTWFYIPGKQLSGPDDTRSTSQGWEWNDILTYDFVYKVRGVIAKDSLK